MKIKSFLKIVALCGMIFSLLGCQASTFVSELSLKREYQISILELKEIVVYENNEINVCFEGVVQNKTGRGTYGRKYSFSISQEDIVKSLLSYENSIKVKSKNIRTGCFKHNNSSKKIEMVEVNFSRNRQDNFDKEKNKLTYIYSGHDDGGLYPLKIPENAATFKYFNSIYLRPKESDNSLVFSVWTLNSENSKVLSYWADGASRSYEIRGLEPKVNKEIGIDLESIKFNGFYGFVVFYPAAFVFDIITFPAQVIYCFDYHPDFCGIKIH